jgi:hypothetical protein
VDDERFNSFATHSRPVRLSVQDTSLSSWKGGFDSRTGHSWPSGVIGKHATLRMSCPCGVGVRVSPWSLQSTQASQCSAEFHKLSPSGATPEPAIYGRVRKLVKRRGREPRDFVSSTLTSATRTIPWSNGEDAWMTTRKKMVQLHPGSLCESVCRCFGRHTSSVRRKAGFESRTDL